MQREERHFNTHPHQTENEGHDNGAAVIQLREQGCHIHHIKRSGHDIEVTHPQQVKTPPHGAHEEVIQARHGRTPGSHADQGIAGQ